MENYKTRREAVSYIIGGAALFGTASMLSSCSGDIVEKAMKANEELVKQVDKNAQRLPLGSIIETELGRWMIVGHRPILYMDDNLNATVDENKCWTFDYQCLAWPAGNRILGDGCSHYAFFNIGDIQKVLYIGLINDEDKDYRNWIDNSYNPYKYNPITEEEHYTGVLYATSPALYEQLYRLKQNLLSQDLYGDCFDGGILCTDIASTGTETLSPEIEKIAAAQKQSKSN